MNNHYPLVSIIVPVYNQGLYLQETLESILNQTYKNYECIIINDGSSDNTQDIAISFCNRDNRFLYMSQENKGVVNARNTAIKKSKGIYILPVDGDDKIASDFIELAVYEIENNKNAKIITAETVLFGEKEGKSQLFEHSLSTILAFNTLPCTCLFRRIDYDSVGGYKEYMKDGLEDWDFWISMLEKGGDVIKINKTGLYYRIREQSRNKEANITSKQLRRQIIIHHPDIYFDNYRKIWRELYEIKQSRKYIIITKLDKLLHPKKLYGKKSN